MPARKQRGWTDKILRGAACLTALAATAAAAPQSDTSTLHVSMDVLPSCTVTATPLAFGDYDSLVAHLTQPLDGTGTITTVCTPNTRMVIEIDAGQNAVGGARQMAVGSERLRYEVYSDTGRSQRWGRSTQAIRFLTPANSIAPITRTVYGRVPGGQSIEPGNYRDTIEVVLHF
jgi:spore coat protein U-like protein